MKLLYGVQGTGNGHITRARLLCRELRLQGHQVDVLMTGRQSNWPEIAEFGDYQKLKGISFHHKQGRVDQWRTLKSLSLYKSYRDATNLDLSGYDLLINDFEPISAWAAKQYGLPSVSISHQAAFLSDVPAKNMSLFNRQLLRYFAPCEQQLGVHWYHFNQQLLPPIVEHLPMQSEGETLLVYLPFESLSEVCALLQRFSQHQFVCFHPHVDVDQQWHNVALKKISRSGFAQHLSACGGVFCNAGFELPSEALFAGKKLLVKPLQGQFEQSSNAYTLQSLALAQVMDTLDPVALDLWLKQDRSEPVVFPNVAKLLAESLCQNGSFNRVQLTESMWQQVHYPSATQLIIDEIENKKLARPQSLSKLGLHRQTTVREFDEVYK